MVPPMLDRTNDRLCELMSGLCLIFAHATRIRLFCALQDGPKNVSDLAQKAGVALPNASQHLRLMREKGALVSEKCGQNIYYRISDVRLVRAVELIRDAMTDQIQHQASEIADAPQHARANDLQATHSNRTIMPMADLQLDPNSDDMVLVNPEKGITS